ncbi:Metallo-dependent phosphatase-like protein [Tribonema minus]|uniref:Metallo-dependent phosphatase-like protein n=1 Tax=Tribonema minus TaxID=303371 RepID=A0A835Z3D9_9STRA|nr:Metallo-dependent phosphatase-like protein [Tribonema minus]
MSALNMAGLVDSTGHWAGGETVMVQSGDVFDRGEHDLVVEELLYCLAEEAAAAGGAVHTILGNHEALNACGDHTMAARTAFQPFDDLKPELEALLGDRGWGGLMQMPEWSRCRIAAMYPGGPVGAMLANHGVTLKVGDSLIVHAGVLPRHLELPGGLEGLNQRTWEWLTNAGPLPDELLQEASPVWTRLYSSPDSVDLHVRAVQQLDEVLQRTGTKRMIVGHTPQRIGINSAADGKVWRVDTAMCAIMGGKPEVLEICGDEIAVLTEYGRVPAEERRAWPRRKRAQQRQQQQDNDAEPEGDDAEPEGNDATR